MRKDGLTLGEESKGISVTQVLLRREALNEVVTISAVVVSSGNGKQMSGLVEDSRPLVLVVAGTAGGGQVGEEDRAVHHVFFGRQSAAGMIVSKCQLEW